MTKRLLLTVAQTTQNIWHFMVGKSILQEIATLAIIQEISDSNLETGRYGPKSGVSWIMRESWQHCDTTIMTAGCISIYNHQLFPKKFCSDYVLSYSFQNNISSLCTGVISQYIIYHLKNLLIIHMLKDKQKKLQLFLVSISDKDTVKLYIQFFRPK